MIRRVVQPAHPAVSVHPTELAQNVQRYRQIQPVHPVLANAPNHVFRNAQSRTPTPYHFLRQAKPNVGVYAWQPNRGQHMITRIQPHENGTFFANLQRSGLGMVGPPGDVDYLGSNVADVTGIATGFGTNVPPRIKRQRFR